MSIDGKVVPVEPTIEMVAAGANAVLPPASAADIALARKAAMLIDHETNMSIDMLAATIATMIPFYRAMLAAAPAAGVEGELVAGCSRSHPHEDMGIACKLRTEVARVRCAAVRGDAAIPGVNLDIILEAAAALERPTTDSNATIESGGSRLQGPHGGLKAVMPNPTGSDLVDPLFNAIWDVTKNWDVNAPDYYDGYCGMNGSHVMLIVNALRPTTGAKGGAMSDIPKHVVEALITQIEGSMDYSKPVLLNVLKSIVAAPPRAQPEALATRIRAVADEIHPYCQEDLGPDELWNRLWGKLRGIANDLEAKK